MRAVQTKERGKWCEVWWNRQAQRAGVREFWIVDPETHVVSVYTLEDGMYHAAAVYSVGHYVPAGVLDDCKIDLSMVFSEA